MQMEHRSESSSDNAYRLKQQKGSLLLQEKVQFMPARSILKDG